MKLIYCTECEDIRNLHFYWSSCRCQNVWGKYIDSVNAIIQAKNIDKVMVLGISSQLLNGNINPKESNSPAWVLWRKGVLEDHPRVSVMELRDGLPKEGVKFNKPHQHYNDYADITNQWMQRQGQAHDRGSS